MRLAGLALIAVALLAQDSAREAKFAAGNGELRYLYSPAAAAGAPLLVVLPGVTDDASVRKMFEQWQAIAASRAWSCVAPFVNGVSDPAVRALDLILADAKNR